MSSPVTASKERSRIWKWWMISENAKSVTRIQWRKEEEEEEEGQEKKMENEVIRGIIASVPKEADTVGGCVTGNTVPSIQSTDDGEDLFSKSVLGLAEGLAERNRAEQKEEVGLLSHRRRVQRGRFHGLMTR